jgi:hypothetical protein
VSAGQNASLAFEEVIDRDDLHRGMALVCTEGTRQASCLTSFVQWPSSFVYLGQVCAESGAEACWEFEAESLFLCHTKPSISARFQVPHFLCRHHCGVFERVGFFCP